MTRLAWLVVAILVLAGVAYAGLTATVSCTGTGVARPSLVVTPTELAFGDVPTDSTVVRVLTLRNAGTGTLTGTVRPAAGCGPGYSLLAGDGTPVALVPYALAAGATLAVSVRFRPAAPGAQVCALSCGP